MSRIVIFALAIAVFGPIFSQNLVPNGGFENLRNIPCDYVQPGNIRSLYADWKLPTAGTSDFFTTEADVSCYANPYSTATNAAGYQKPHGGKAMAAILTYGSGCTGNLPNYREYLHIELSKRLVVGKKYYASMWVSHADSTKLATNNLGMVFTNFEIDLPQWCVNLDTIPIVTTTQVVTQDTQWVAIADTFTAHSDYGFLTLGNFKSDSETLVQNMPDGKSLKAQYFIDDVAVFEMCGSTSTTYQICPGDALVLQANINLGSHIWNTGQVDQSITITDTGTFWVQTDFAGCLTTDSFFVAAAPCFKLALPNVFTPNDDGINDLFKPIESVGITAFTLEIYNRFGVQVYQTNAVDFIWDGTLNGNPLADGIYFWRYLAQDLIGSTYTKQGAVTLVR